MLKIIKTALFYNKESKKLNAAQAKRPSVLQ